MVTVPLPAAKPEARRFLLPVGLVLGAVVVGGVFDVLTGTPGTVMSAVVETVQQLLPGAVGGEQISDAIVESR